MTKGSADLGGTVGVVMPVLDAVDTVDDAIDSVVAELAQLTGGSRIIVVDGGSTDGTTDRLAARADIELVHQRGHGLAAARNQGVARLQTDLVTFCDADDRWPVGGLLTRVQHLREHPTCAAVAGTVSIEPIDGHRPPLARLAQIGRSLPGYTPGAVLLRRSVWGVVGWFDEQLQIASDSAWFTRLLESELRFDLIDDVVLRKGIRSASLSTEADRYRDELLVVVRGHLQRQRDRPPG